jgi:hypothetical protein
LAKLALRGFFIEDEDVHDYIIPEVISNVKRKTQIKKIDTEMFNQVTMNSITAGIPSYEITYGVIYPVNSLETLKIPTRGQ